MLKLNTDAATRVSIDLGGEAALTAKPATTSIIYGTRDMLVAAARGDLLESEDGETPSAFTQISVIDWVIAVAKAAVEDWAGIGDEAGEGIACTPDAVALLLEQFPAAYNAFRDQYFDPALKVAEEGNA